MIVEDQTYDKATNSFISTTRPYDKGDVKSRVTPHLWMFHSLPTGEVKLVPIEFIFSEAGKMANCAEKFDKVVHSTEFIKEVFLALRGACGGFLIFF